MNKNNLIVQKVIEEADEVKTLVFSLENENTKFCFEAGQYLELFFLDAPDQIKPYTISNFKDNKIYITVKKIGHFSGKLFSLKKNDVIGSIGPEGFFTLEEVENEDKEIVFIAGGIAITPFYSILKLKNIKKSHLFYSNRKKKDALFFQDLEKMKSHNFNLHHFLSQDNKEKGKNIINRRLQFSDLKNNLNNLEECNFFICGSIEYVDFFWKTLRKNNIPDENIFTEVFFKS